MEIKEQNHGFQAPEYIAPEHYVLGASELPQEILRPDGQWHDFVPDIEVQKKNGLETMNCTNYGTLNCIETLHICKWPNEPHPDYSERYTGVLTGTTRNGNDPHKVAEIIREYAGLIPESDLPFGSNICQWTEYYSPSPMSENLLEEGKRWLAQYELGHEWVFPFGTSVAEKHTKIKEALKLSPVGASVYAWAKDDNDLFFKNGPDNHWIMIIGYQEGAFWEIFDQYDGCFKELVWDFDFGFAKRYHLDRKIIQTPARPISVVPEEGFWARVFQFIKWFLTKQQTT